MMRHFNTSLVLGKLRLQENTKPVNPPVTILSYCLLPNHYHLLLRCNNNDGGLSKYLQRIGGGYTMYFNQKYQRNGALFQGKFKSKYIENDNYLRNILAYVTYNNLIHNIKDTSLYRSSLNTNDGLVRGLSSNFSQEKMLEIVEIIKEVRSSRKDLELEWCTLRKLKGWMRLCIQPFRLNNHIKNGKHVQTIIVQMPALAILISFFRYRLKWDGRSAFVRSKM